MSVNELGFPERVGACRLHGVLRVSVSPGSLPLSGSTVGCLWVHLREWEAQVAVDRSHRERDEGMKPTISSHLCHMSVKADQVRDLRQSTDEGSCSHPLMILPQVHRWESLLVEVFDQMFPFHCLDSSWTKQRARSVEGKRWSAA